jgi:SAM-dependent methyltransferase
MPSEAQLIELQQTLYSSRNPTRRWLHSTRRSLIIDAVQRSAERTSKLRALEVGFGSGVYLPSLAQLFEDVTAIDVEQGYLRLGKTLAETHGNIRVIHDDIMRTELPAETFELVLCSEVIEHITDSRAALIGMHKVLKPGGVLVLSTPQRWSLLELTGKLAFLPGIINLVKLIYGEAVLDPGHINLLTERQVIEQLTYAGFRIRESFKSGLYLPVIAEFTGGIGLRLEQYLESWLSDMPFSGLVWTQYYIAERQ